MKVRAIILAGGKGTRLKVLTRKRAKPAVPFAGKYRIIDFTLSNCVNSGIYNVLILTQYRPHSLNDHISKGRPWDLDRTLSGGVQMLQPFTGLGDHWYEGTADAVYQNLSFIKHAKAEASLILSGDHIYKMDYSKMIDFHEEKGADVTICTINVPLDEAFRFGILDVDEDNLVTDFVEKPSNPPSTLASMGVYIFNDDAMDDYLKEDAKRTDSSHDFGKDIIPRMLEDGAKIYAYPFQGYWVDVGTIDAYWSTHMDLLKKPPVIDLYDRSWVIHTRSEERPPVRIEDGAEIVDSMMTNGCVIAKGARIENSVLSPGVYVGPDAVVKESIILTDTYIEAGASVYRAVIDKDCVIGHKANIGEGEDDGEDFGIVTIGKNSHLPSGIVVGRGARIGADLKPKDFEVPEIEEDAYIHSAVVVED